MCHNSGLVKNNQIDRFVENGMPQKIVKTVKYTIRKRAEEYKRKNVSNVEDDAEEACEETCNCSSKATATKTTRTTTAPAAAAAVSPVKTMSTTSPSRTPINSESMANSSQQQQRSAAAAKQQEQKPAQQLTCPFGRGFGQVKESIEDIAEVVAGGVGAHFHTPSSSTSAASVSTSNHHPSYRKQHHNHQPYTDILAVFTQWTKKFFAHLSITVESLQKTKIYTVLTKTTQPAHLIAVFILAFILLTVWPEISENKYAAESSKKTDQGKSHHLAVLAYLGAFATHFGAQIWMTFVSGLSLYFALPRHTFGQCQQILFPKYFALNAMLSIVMVILFVKFFLGGWSYASCIQLTALSLTAVIEVIVRLYLAPPMLRLMHEKYKIEDAVGSGQEVGGLVQGDLVQCPHYQRIHKMFRRIHMTVAIGNIITLLCTSLHLYYLASKISFRVEL